MNGTAHINGMIHHSMFTTKIPKRAEILGVSPLVANKIKTQPKPAVNPDHKKGSPPYQPIAKEANQGTNIKMEKINPTMATIWLAALNSLESITSSRLTLHFFRDNNLFQLIIS